MNAAEPSLFFMGLVNPPDPPPSASAGAAVMTEHAAARPILLMSRICVPPEWRQREAPTMSTDCARKTIQLVGRPPKISPPETARTRPPRAGDRPEVIAVASR